MNIFHSQLWEGKLAASKALEPPPSDNDVMFAPGNMTVLPQSVQGAQAQQTNLGEWSLVMCVKVLRLWMI